MYEGTSGCGHMTPFSSAFSVSISFSFVAYYAEFVILIITNEKGCFALLTNCGINSQYGDTQCVLPLVWQNTYVLKWLSVTNVIDIVAGERGW